MIGQYAGGQINEQGDIIRRPRRYALVVTSHRGDLYLPSSLETWKQNLPWDRFEQRILHLDGPVGGAFPEFEVVRDSLGRRFGLAKSVARAWQTVRPEITHVFHLEEDFHLLEPVDLDAMADVLDDFGSLAQVVLKRQPAPTPEEQLAGGFVEQAPDEYVEVTEPHLWTQHHRIFSLNPCLIPARIVRQGWEGSEGDMTARYLDMGLCFGLWGGKYDLPRVLHVGWEGGMGTPGWKP